MKSMATELPMPAWKCWLTRSLQPTWAPCDYSTVFRFGFGYGLSKRCCHQPTRLNSALLWLLLWQRWSVRRGQPYKYK